jgi:hypothetical protein
VFILEGSVVAMLKVLVEGVNVNTELSIGELSELVS